MPTLIQMNFPHHGPWGEEMTSAFHDLAASINDEPGFLWKVWIENADEEMSGGIYLFDTAEHARAYAAMHAERMRGFGVTALDVRYFDVNVPLSRLDQATIPGA